MSLKYAVQSRRQQHSCVGNNLEEDTPVTDPAPKTGKALQFAEVALKGILLHFRQSSQNARAFCRRLESA